MIRQALAIAAITASQAQAQEVFPLSTHGHWEVSYVDRPGGAYCSASVLGDGLYMSIDVHPKFGLTVFVIDDAKDWTEQSGLTIFAQVDARASWQINTVTSYDKVMEFNLRDEAGMRFLEELSDGRAVQFDYNEEGSTPGYGDVTFSLLGSGAAITALAECAMRL